MKDACAARPFVLGAGFMIRKFFSPWCFGSWIRGAAGAAFLGAAPALAQNRIEWALVTSWGRDAPGPGTTAQRLADRITTASGGALTIRLYAAGERVGGFDVFDAVASGDVQMGHTASFFWTGKVGASGGLFYHRALWHDL